VTSLDFSNDDKFVVIGLSTGEIKIFATPAGPEDYSKTHLPLQSIKGYKEKILSIASAPEQLIVATGNHEEGLKLWDIQTGENTFFLNASRLAIEEIYISNDGSWLASSHEGGLLRIWNVNEAQEAYPPLDGSLPIGAPFSPDSHFLAYIYSLANNRGEVIRVVELESGKIVAELPDYINNAYVQFTDDSKLLVIGTPYKAYIWDVATWEQVDMNGGPTAGCGQFFTPQSVLLATISNAGIMFYPYDPKIQEMCGVKPRGAMLMYYFYEQQKMIFVLGNEKGDIWIWIPNSIDFGRIQSDTPYPTSRKIFLAGDQASGLYAYVSNETIIIKNINGSSIATINEQDDYQYRVALLPAKKMMVLGSKYGSIHIWTLP
jgi:WD40 repeat protein